jgi:hypothetical protein
MTKHTIKDFLDGRICVRCADQDDKQRLLQFCADNGISKAWFSTLDIRQAVSVYNVFFINRDPQELATIADTTSVFCDPVPFSSLAHATYHRRIVIDCSDTITTATLYDGEKAVKSATINRCHSDNPSVHIAAAKVIDKLLAKKAKQPNLKKPAEKDGFKVGDRVVCIHGPCNGNHGTVIGFGRGVAVEFDNNVCGHECAGSGLPVLAKDGHGWWCDAKNLCHEQPTKQMVREVKRHAKVGEWVKIVDAERACYEKYANGDVLRVEKVDRGWVELSCGGTSASPHEYVVLEGYKPEEPTNA